MDIIVCAILYKYVDMSIMMMSILVFFQCCKIIIRLRGNSFTCITNLQSMWYIISFNNLSIIYHKISKEERYAGWKFGVLTFIVDIRHRCRSSGKRTVAHWAQINLTGKFEDRKVFNFIDFFSFTGLPLIAAFCL